jgi:hypothetical protein
LGTLPTPTELTLLVDKELITKAEAREILITEKEVTERDTDSFKEEIKFLKSIIDKLSENKPTVIREYIQSNPIIIQNQRPWVYPYQVWCGTTNTIGGIIDQFSQSNNLAAISGATNCSFSEIKTF